VNTHDILIDAYGRVVEGLTEALDGLKREDLDVMPTADTNPIGWLAWHIGRGQDASVAHLMGEEQLYIKDGWHARFDRPADPMDFGTGHTTEQVAAFRSPEVETFLGYLQAVHARTVAYIRTLGEKDLARELDEPQWQPLPKVGVRLVSVMADGLMHVGQIAYVRGLLKGKGWLPY
jgi:hypothetical protein